MSIGKNIRMLREAAKMSPEELAARLGIEPRLLSEIETEAKSPGLDLLIPLSDTFRFSIRQLISSDLEKIARAISGFDCRFLVMDVDGVLTDGGMYYSESGDEHKKFNTKDGLALIRLAEAGIPTGLISSGTNSNIMKRRAGQLGIGYVYTGTWKKTEALENWCRELGIGLHQVAYIGDDLNDIPVFDLVGLCACPSDAALKVKEKVHVVLETPGGRGCVREFVDRFVMDLI